MTTLSEPEIRKQAEKDLVKKQRYFADKWREENDAVYTAVQEALKDGQMEEEYLPALCERFKCTRRRIRNVIERRSGALSPQTKVIGEAGLVVAFQKMASDIEDAKAEYEQQLEDLARLEADGEKWVEIKQKETEGGKFEGTQTEKVSVPEYRAILLTRINDLHNQFWANASRLLPKRIELIGGRDISSVSDDELVTLDTEIEETEKQLRIEKGGTKVA